MEKSTSSADVKSVRRTAQVLALLSESGEPLRLTDIAAALEMPKSSTHAMLHTLVNHDVLSSVGESSFALSLSFIGRMASVMDGIDLRSVARPEMQRLSEELGVTCNLGVLDGHRIVYVEQVRDRSHPVQLATRIGFSIAAHATALGKVLVAELPPERRVAWLDEHNYEAFTPKTTADRPAMERALTTYRTSGFAVDDEEMLDGIYCVAAPVRDRRGEVIAALSATMFLAAAGDGGRAQLADQVRAAAGRVSAQLGAR